MKNYLGIQLFFLKGSVVSKEVTSIVSDQPRSLEETIKGAHHRAKAVYMPSYVSLGIESGLMKLPNSQIENYYDLTVCSCFDGNNHYLGLSCAFCIPLAFNQWIDAGKDLSQASVLSGLTKDENIGEKEGLIGLLSQGYLDRKSYTKQSIITALMAWKESFVNSIID